jgi:hypothetical protein
MPIPQPPFKNNHEESELAMEESGAHMYGVKGAGDVVDWL